MSDYPLVSILINNYNYARFLGEAIESALNQTYSNIEVIVVDDGSTDSSREVISKFGSRIKSLFKENGGQSSCFNAGFAMSEGEIICFLDADDLFLPSKISTLVAAASKIKKENEDWFLAHFLRLVDENGNILPGRKPDQLLGYNREKLAVPAELFRLSAPEQAQKFAGAYGYLPFLCGTTSGSLLSRSLAEKILPLPERVHGESLDDAGDDLIVSASMLFAPLYFLPEELGQYRVHGKNIRFGIEKKPRSSAFFYNRDSFLNQKLQEKNLHAAFAYFDSRAAQPYFLYHREWKKAWLLALKVVRRRVTFRSLAFALLTPYKIMRAFLFSRP